MNIRFSGVTFYNGPESVVKKKLDKIEENFGNATAYLNGQGVVLDGNDAYDFIKKKYDVEIPEELRKTSKDEVTDIIVNNLKKYIPLIQTLEEKTADMAAFMKNVVEYANAAKAKGQDIDGQPVQEINLSNPA
ncbi:MAG: hypothetical protein K2X66_16050 [Cyanobacteria bacterium]|nr:hypothetical protein [Cyanobacteriota bacterium]